MGFKLMVSGDAVHEFDVEPELVASIEVEGQTGGNVSVPVQFGATEANLYVTLRSENNLEVQEWRSSEEKEKATAEHAPDPEALGSPYKVEEEAPAAETTSTKTETASSSKASSSSKK